MSSNATVALPPPTWRPAHSTYTATASTPAAAKRVNRGAIGRQVNHSLNASAPFKGEGARPSLRVMTPCRVRAPPRAGRRLLRPAAIEGHHDRPGNATFGVQICARNPGGRVVSGHGGQGGAGRRPRLH